MTSLSKHWSIYKQSFGELIPCSSGKPPVAKLGVQDLTGVPLVNGPQLLHQLLHLRWQAGGEGDVQLRHQPHVQTQAQ